MAGRPATAGQAVRPRGATEDPRAIRPTEVGPAPLAARTPWCAAIKTSVGASRTAIWSADSAVLSVALGQPATSPA